MTARLLDDADALAMLISQAAEHYGIRETYVEKDFWVTETLRVAAVPREVELRSGGPAHTTFRL